MTRVLVLAFVLVWIGAALVCSQFRWFRRTSMVDRLSLYLPHGSSAQGTTAWSVESFRDVIGPLCQTLGERCSRALGIGDDLATRLRRADLPLDAGGFRVRQLGTSLGAALLGVGLAAASAPPPVVALVFVVAPAVVAFALTEQRLSDAARRRQHRLGLELPIVAEQLGMLLGAGYSLGGALHRVAVRGSGVCSEGFVLVHRRIGQGLTEVDALREWAEWMDVPALDRLVGVLALNAEAADLGRLIGEEARSIRRDHHRDLIELMERRGQQVWIPVTVATLVPGVIFIAIPFIEAMRLFSST